MPIQSNFTLPPPKYWEEFEDLLCDLFRAVWQDPNTTKNGRLGQKQNGVDVFGQPELKGRWAGVQAKRKDRLLATVVTEKELVAEVNKAKKFNPPLTDFIVATTGPRDASLQEKARLITAEHQRAGLFRVYVYSWEEIETLLNRHQEVRKRWYPDILSDDKIVEELDSVQIVLKEQAAEQSKRSNETNLSLAALSEQIRILSLSVAAPGAGSQKLYQIAIDEANAFLDQLKPQTALIHLEALRERAWEEADQITKWKVLTNIAAAKLLLNEEIEATQLLIQATHYNPGDEKALSNLAFAYLLLGNHVQAEHTIEIVLQKNPVSESAYALKVKLLSLQNKDFDTITENVPPELRMRQEIAGSLGDAAAKGGDVTKAHYWYRIAYNDRKISPEIALAYAASLLAPLVEKRSILHRGKIAKDQAKQIETILEIYNSIYEVMSNSECVEAKANFFFNRGIAYRFLNDYENAAKNLDLASNLEPKNEKTQYHSAIVAFLSGKKDFAILKLENLKTSMSVPAASFLAMLYQEKAEVLKSKETLLAYLENAPPSKWKEQAHRLLVVLLTDSEQYEEAEKESKALLATNPEDIQNILLRARVLKGKGNEKDAKEHLVMAQALFNEQSSFEEILSLADQCYILQAYEDAIRYYELIADISVDEDITGNLLVCYHHLGKEQEALHICASLRQNHGPLKIIAEIEASIYEGIGNLEKAKSICNEYLQQYPNDLGIQLRLASIHLRAQQFNEVDAFLKQQHTVSNAPLEEQLHLCQLFRARRFDDEALKIAYEIRRRFPNEANAHFQYIETLLTREKEEDHLLEIREVKEDVAVLTKDSFGRQKWYILENRSDADSSKNEFPLTHAFIKKLLGRGVGSTVVLVESPQKKEETILEIKSKYLYALQESTANFAAYFPEAEGRFHVFNLNILNGPGTEEPEAFSFLFDMLDKHDHYWTTLLDLYRNGQLTIGAVAKMLHRNPIEVWGLLINSADVGVRSAVGNHREFADAKIALTGESPLLVADVTSLLTFHGLAIADEIAQAFGRIAISQSTVDVFTDMITSKFFMRKKGYLTIGKERDTYIKEEVTPEQLQKNADYLQGILNWIRKKCDILPCEEALTINAGQRKILYDFFGADTIDSVLLAKQEKRIFVSDDAHLRNHAKSSFGIDCTWTQPILKYLVSKTIIDDKKYQSLIIKLILINYTHTSVGVATMEEAAKESQWKPSRRFEKVANVLNGEMSTELSAIEVVVEFVYILYSQRLFLADPDPLLFIMLDAFFKSREKRGRLLAQLKHRIQAKFFLHPLRRQEVESLIQQWSFRQTLF